MRLDRLFTGLLIALLFAAASLDLQAAISFRAATSSGTPDGGAGVPITFVGAGTAATANAGNVTPGLPAGTQVNDILIAVIESRATGAISMTGWTQVNTGTSGSDHRASLFWRRATGGDPTTVTNAGGAGIGARIIGFRGVVTAGSPFDAANSFTLSGNDNTVEAGAISTVSANTMLVFTAHANNDFDSVGTPAGSTPWTQAFFTEYNPGGGGNDLAISAYYGLRAAVGAKAAVQATATGGNAVSHGAQLALRPAASGPSITINVPSGTTTDDVMVAVISYRDNTAVTITPPAGWTSRSRIAQAAGNANVQEVFTRVASGAEPASYTWTFSGTITGAAGGIATYIGVDTSSSVDVIAGNVNPAGTSFTANSVNTTIAGTRVISSHSYSSAETWTPPAGMTERVDVASIATPNAAGVALEINDVLQDAVGATGNKTATAAGNADTGVSHVLALRPRVSRMHVVLPGQTFTPGLGATGTPTTQTQNIAFDLVQLVVTDTSNNILTSYSGARTINYTGPAGLPSFTTAVNFTNGVSTTTLTTTLDTVETTTITATESGDVTIVGITSTAFDVVAAGGTSFVGVCDDFDTGAFPGADWTFTGNAATASRIVNSSPNSLEISGGGTIVTSRVMDTADVINLQFDVWIGRGDDAFSENPDGGEDLEIQYLNDSATWISLETFAGGPQGGIFTRSYNLPVDAQHANFQVRFLHPNGTSGFDFWHVDDVCISGENLGGVCTFDFGLQSGFPGNYFNNMTLTPPVTNTRIDGPVDFNWGSGTPGVTGIGDNNFSVRWEGVLRITETDTYRFQTDSDDGVRLFVDNVLVIDNFTDHAVTTDTSGNVNLTAGEIYDIRLEYYENGGLSEIRLRWGDASNGFSYVPIPAGPFPVYGEGLYFCDSSALLFFEADSVTLNDTTTTPAFTPVNFRQTYPSVPLVFVLPTNENPDPAAIRIRNVTTTGFELTQVEPQNQDGRSVPMRVDYIAITEGVFTLPDGRTIEAGTHTTQSLQSGGGVPGPTNWDTVNFTSTFNAPSLLLQIQGQANESSNPPVTTSIPWLTASARNVGNTSFETALERSEVNDGGTISSDETIAYLAIDGNVQGSFAAQGTTILYESIVTPDSIQGWDNENCAGNVGERSSFVNTYSQTPLAIAHTRRRDGGDGGWIRRCFMDENEIGLAYDEDIFRDPERTHTTEQASILVFSEAFCFPTCVAGTIDHYDIDFGAGNGITCLPVDVTFTAKDASNATVNHDAVTTIDFATSTGRGTWSATASAGSGSVLPGIPGSGESSYQFPIGESSFTLALNYPDLAGASSETFNINITSTINENSGVAPADVDPGDGSDDPTIDYFLTGIIYNNVTDGNNTISTQISGKPSNTGFNNKALSLQVVRATDNDSSVCASIFGPGDVVSIELGAECKTPAVCAGRELNISNPATPGQDIATSSDDGDNDNADSVAAYEPVSLEFGADSAAEIVLTYPDAGALELHARYELLLDDGTPSGEFATGISNTFVVRPFGFAIGLIQDAGTVANPGAVDATGSVFVKAGEDFSFSVGAFNWGMGDDDGSSCDLTNDPACLANDGIPDTNADLFDNNGGGTPAALTPNFAGTGAVAVTFAAAAPFAPAAGTLGTLIDSGTLGTPIINAAAFAAGIASINTAYYDEVGTITLAASAMDYLATGQGIAGRSSNLAANPNNGSVGRFVPDRFLIIGNGGPSLLNSCDAGGFTYMDDSFSYATVPAIELEAVNTYGAPTLNYGDGGTAATDFFKLPTALQRVYDDNAINNGATFNSSQGASVIISGADDFADGRAVLALTNSPGARDVFMFERDSVAISAAEGAPFTASIDVLFQVTAGSLYDPDSSGARQICYDGDADGNCEFDGSDDYSALTDSGGTALALAEMRFGRLAIGNAAGSELLPVTLPFRTEFFNGSNFIVNSDDVCTSIAVTDLLLDSAVEAAVGDGDIDISNAAGCGNGLATATIGNDPFVAGNGELVFTLGIPAAGCTGYIDVVPASLPTWLRYDWDDDDGNEDGPYDDNPVGRAEFGVFEGPAEYIYIREPW